MGRKEAAVAVGKKGNKRRRSAILSESDDDNNEELEEQEETTTGLNIKYLDKRAFKNPNFKSNSRLKLKQALNQEKLLLASSKLISPLTATYWNIDAPPTLKPQKKFCDVTGLVAHYTDPKSGLRYHDASIFPLIRALQPYSVESYLALRKANAVIK